MFSNELNIMQNKGLVVFRHLNAEILHLISLKAAL